MSKRFDAIVEALQPFFPKGDSTVVFVLGVYEQDAERMHIFSNIPEEEQVRFCGQMAVTIIHPLKETANDRPPYRPN